MQLFTTRGQIVSEQSVHHGLHSHTPRAFEATTALIYHVMQINSTNVSLLILPLGRPKQAIHPIEIQSVIN